MKFANINQLRNNGMTIANEITGARRELQDVDIIVVAQTIEEAAEIVEKVIEKVRLAYGYVVIFETPCSVPLPNSMYTSLLFSRWTVPSDFFCLRFRSSATFQIVMCR